MVDRDYLAGFAEFRAKHPQGLTQYEVYRELSKRNDRLIAALKRTEDNLSRLIDAKHSDEVLMSPWRDEVRAAIRQASEA